MKKLLIVCLLTAFAGFAYAGTDETNDSKASAPAAQTITVTGTVIDLKTGEALAGVEISLNGTDLKAYSDFDGNFTISDLKPGEYDIVASYISYKKSLVEDFKADGSQEVEIKLQAD